MSRALFCSSSPRVDESRSPFLMDALKDTARCGSEDHWLPTPSTRSLSLESLSTRPVGVPAGAHIPYQIGKSTPATPASAIVGTCGSKIERRAVVTPSGNSLPSRIGVKVIEMGAIMYVVRPSIVAP